LEYNYDIKTSKQNGVGKMNEKILIADDDKDIANLVKDILEDEGFETERAFSGDDALKKILSKNYDLIILDIMLPGIDGFEICKKVREKTNVPILFLSAKTKSMDKVLGFEFGADDYITKPFDNYELIARVKAHIRRNRKKENLVGEDSSFIRFKGIEVNKASYEVFIEGQSIELSNKEFNMLLYLMENANIVLTRDQMYNNIWGYEEYGDINTVTVHIKKLREKIDREGKFIKTIWGTGYKFVGEKL
jgi:DNA-binding response OmpR family regulator